jgi:hypothetical protein
MNSLDSVRVVERRELQLEGWQVGKGEVRRRREWRKLW